MNFLEIKNIEFILPLGEECCTSQSIDSKFNSTINLRKVAFPFDYVGHTYIETVYEKIKNMIETGNFLSKEDIEIKLFGDTYFFSDKKYKLHYWHDISHSCIDDFSLEDWNLFIDKYQRRYKRLIEKINSNEKILFLSVNHFDNIYNYIYKKDSLIQLYTFLKSLNKNIQFLAINFEDSSFQYNDLYHIKLDYSRNESFEESKNNFQQILNHFIASL